MKHSICTIDGCERKHYSRQRCRRHYAQLYKVDVREPIHCKFCGDLFMPRTSVRKHCYSTECQAEKNREAVREFYAREREAGISKWQRERAGYRRYTKTCQQCGVAYRTAKRFQKYCDPECSAAARRGQPRRRPREIIVYSPPREIRQEQPALGVLIGSTCKACAATFIAFVPDDYCSSECKHQGRREDQDRRRARKRGVDHAESVDRIKVFEADGYRCHICGGKTDPAVTYPHPRYPTIDHIIPIKLGGKHVQSNCATACNECNLRKNATGTGDQLRLFSYV